MLTWYLRYGDSEFIIMSVWKYESAILFFSACLYFLGFIMKYVVLLLNWPMASASEYTCDGVHAGEGMAMEGGTFIFRCPY